MDSSQIRVSYTFDLQTVDIIIAALRKMPMEMVEGLVVEIRTGAVAVLQQHQAQQQAKEAPQVQEP